MAADQISAPELPSAASGPDLPVQQLSSEDAGEVEFQPPAAEDSSPDPEGGTKKGANEAGEEEFQPPAAQDSSPDPEGGVEDGDELKGGEDTVVVGEQQQPPEEGKEEEEDDEENPQEEGDKEENPESFREAKRRRTSPGALQKPEDAKPCCRSERGGVDEAIGFGGGFSFSFDVRGVTSPIETTPRFGSMVSRYTPGDLVTAAAAIGGGRGPEDEVTGKAAAAKATTLGD